MAKSDSKTAPTPLEPSDFIGSVENNTRRSDAHRLVAMMREITCRDLGIVLYVLPPRSPKLNGCVERFNRTTRAEFWRWYTGLTTVADTTTALQRWTARYNATRHHTSLGYQTPLAFLDSFERTL